MTNAMNGQVTSILAWTPGPWEIVIIFVAVLLLFGGKKLPELARGLARGLRIFRSELKGVKEDIEQTTTVAPSNQEPAETETKNTEKEPSEPPKQQN